MRVPCRVDTSMLGQTQAFESLLSPKPARAFLMIYFVYILISQKDNSFYIGQTNNIDDRLKRHNAGQERYTKTKFLMMLRSSRSTLFPYATLFLSRNIKNLKSRKRILEFIRGKGNHSDIL